MTTKDYTANAELKIIVKGNWVTYEGTKEQLINEGVCENVTFPEGNKRENSYHETGRGNSKSWIIKKIKGGRFSLQKGTFNGEPILTRPRPENYQSIDKWLEKNKENSKMLLGMIYGNFSGELEKEHHGSVTIKAPQNQINRLVEALGKVDELIDEMTAIRANPKITKAKEDSSFQSLLKSVVGAE